MGGIMRSKLVLSAVGLAVTVAVAQTKPTREPFFLHEENYPGELVVAMLCGAVVGAGTAVGSGFVFAAAQHRVFSASELGVQVLSLLKVGIFDVVIVLILEVGLQLCGLVADVSLKVRDALSQRHG